LFIEGYFFAVSLVLYQRNSKEITKQIPRKPEGGAKKWPKNGKETTKDRQRNGKG
jgi:hypothetical protein